MVFRTAIETRRKAYSVINVFADDTSLSGHQNTKSIIRLHLDVNSYKLQYTNRTVTHKPTQ